MGESPWPGTLAAGTAVVLGAWLVQHGGLPPGPTTEQALGAGPPHAAAAPLPYAVPSRISIPAIGVDAPVAQLALGPDGRLTPPPEDDPNLAGWYRDGVSPGQRGTAVMAGHVDNRQGPAVFYALGSLRKGDLVRVERDDRSAALFDVDAVEVYAARDFPDQRVYGPAPDAELRLITCGGAYTPEHGYSGNVVVYAHLSGAARH